MIEINGKSNWTRSPAREIKRDQQQFGFLGSEDVKRLEDAALWETSVQGGDKIPKHIKTIFGNNI